MSESPSATPGASGSAASSNPATLQSLIAGAYAMLSIQSPGSAASLLEGRVYHLRAPTGTARPHLTFDLIDASPTPFMDGQADLVATLVVTLEDSSDAGAATLAAVQAALQRTLAARDAGDAAATAVIASGVTGASAGRAAITLHDAGRFHRHDRSLTLQSKWRLRWTAR